MQCGRVATKYMIYAVTRKRLAAGIPKNRLVRIGFVGRRLGYNGGDRFRPEWTNPLLSSFPVQIDSRPWQKIFVPKNSDFADSGTSIIKEKKQSIIASAGQRLPIWMAEESLHHGRIEIMRW